MKTSAVFRGADPTAYERIRAMQHNEMPGRQCTFGIGSVTYAMKAKELLAKSGISARVIRLKPEQSPNGCAYGLELACREGARASALLGSAGIRFTLLK